METEYRFHFKINVFLLIVTVFPLKIALRHTPEICQLYLSHSVSQLEEGEIREEGDSCQKNKQTECYSANLHVSLSLCEVRVKNRVKKTTTWRSEGDG